jgi:5-methyltetrahydropteroyltriglutamate--homocysteine methyltransferase
MDEATREQQTAKAATITSMSPDPLAWVTRERLILAPNCGMKYLPHDIAFGKRKALVEGTNLVRDELG